MRLSITPCVLAVACLTAPGPAQTLLRTISGENSDDEFGAAMADVGDTNGDGYDDVLVGAPGYNGDRGAVYCVSGKYLAVGAPPKFLWSLAPAGDVGDRFGAAVAVAGNLNSGTVIDFLVGAPGDDNANGVDAGAIYAIDGTNHTLRSPMIGPAASNFGASLDGCGDLSGDALADVVVGAPGGTQPGFYVVSGYAVWYLGGNYAAAVLHSLVDIAASGLGRVVRSGFDLDQDGHRDILATAPLASGSFGFMEIRSGATFALLAYQWGTQAGEHFGNSADAGRDFDGDGVVDVLIGAPDAGSGTLGHQGRAVALSGAALRSFAANTTIYEWTGSTFFTRLGASVDASADLNGDGVGEILVGGPGAGGTLGAAWIYSGASGTKMGSYTGVLNANLGSTLVGGFDDLTGDGFAEFVVAGSGADAAGLTNNGTLKCLKLFPTAPVSYCTSKTNSLGCAPSIATSGSASVSSSSAFDVTGANFIDQRSGLLFYGFAPSSSPFQGGTLCVEPPTLRTTLQNSGGSSGGASCTGAYSFDFNAWIQAGLDPNLTVGRQVFAQYWARDPQSASTTSLSNAISFLVNP